MKNFPLLIFVLILALYLTSILDWHKALSSDSVYGLPGISAPATAAAINAGGGADSAAPDGGGDSSAVGSSPTATDLKKWRRSMQAKCDEAKTAEDVDALEASFREAATAGGYALPLNSSPPPEQPRDPESGFRRCKNVVIDFGANVGDTMGHVMDTGLPGCDRSADLKKGIKPAHFNLNDRSIDHSPWNRITDSLMRMMKSRGADIGPEDYCYYGVEGNPVFTDRLRSLEDWAMAIEPRPLEHLHFFTESIGSGKDGPAKLYLDTVNKKENFWGSSVYKTHQDVVKSGEKNDNEPVAADVMGYTITTLMKKTLKAFNESLPESERGGGHLLLKVDIEGGEYDLLFEIHKSGLLCEFVKLGNTADLMIEFHSGRVTGV